MSENAPASGEARAHADESEGWNAEASTPQAPAWQAELETIADWRADLSARIARARLRFDLVGLSPEAIIELAAEVKDFERAAKALCRGIAL